MLQPAGSGVSIGYHYRRCRCSGCRDGYKNAQGGSIDQITSDSEGNFNFEGIPDGTYMITIFAAGYSADYPVNANGGNVTYIKFLGIPEGTTAMGGRVTGWDDDIPMAHPASILRFTMKPFTRLSIIHLNLANMKPMDLICFSTQPLT